MGRPRMVVSESSRMALLASLNEAYRTKPQPLEPIAVPGSAMMSQCTTSPACRMWSFNSGHVTLYAKLPTNTLLDPPPPPPEPRSARAATQGGSSSCLRLPRLPRTEAPAAAKPRRASSDVAPPRVGVSRRAADSEAVSARPPPLPPPPPPGGSRSSRTKIFRPRSSVSVSSRIARCASEGDENSTMPQPLEPMAVPGSESTSQCSTSPTLRMWSFKSCHETFQSMFPT
mmetsp:Transcript_62973/g.169253  ORF Transcript_62973/g.169253 Transcript_62973/m.169253 type:complete len:229 (-) Transcript_62973:74-760(-)